MELTKSIFAVAVLSALAIGCATPYTNVSGYEQSDSRITPNRTYGVIESITSERAGNYSALLGTVIGGVAGATVGNEVGDGRSNDIATVAGAVGGAVVGRKIDKAHDRKNSKDTNVIRLRLDDGSRQVMTQETVGELRIGDSVQIENGGVRGWWCWTSGITSWSVPCKYR